MEIVYRKLSELKPNPKNPRKQSPKGVEDLAESIKSNPAFFEARPILLSDRTGEFVIIGGERRSEAARLLGMEEVPTILIQGLTEAKEDEIMVRDNTHNGVWDEAKLAAMKKQWGGAIDEWTNKDDALNVWNKGKERKVGQIEFSEVLNEEHNYIVLYFDNSVDWLQLMSLLKLDSVKSLSTRRDGKVTKGNSRFGIGRVLKGPDVLERLKEAFGK